MKNRKVVTVQFLKYGHWVVSSEFYGKTRAAVTCDSLAVDSKNTSDGYRTLRAIARSGELMSDRSANVNGNFLNVWR